MGAKIIHYFACWVVQVPRRRRGRRRRRWHPWRPAPSPNLAGRAVQHPPASSPVEGDGGSWLGKHLHGLLPVGGPFLGARKSYRAVLSGEDMGIGQFLNGAGRSMTAPARRTQPPVGCGGAC
jgi:hypothetical protein